MNDAADAFSEANRSDAEIIRRQRVRLLRNPEAELRRIDAKRLCDLVDLNLLTEPALRRAVAALRTARRFVREYAAALELVRRDAIGDRLERTPVKRAGDAVRSVRASVEQRLHVHACDRSVVFDARSEPHQDGMPPAAAVEHLLPRPAD